LQQGIRLVVIICDHFFNFAFRIQPHDLEVMQYMLIHVPVFYPDQSGELFRGDFSAGKQMPVTPVHVTADPVLLPGLWGIVFWIEADDHEVDLQLFLIGRRLDGLQFREGGGAHKTAIAVFHGENERLAAPFRQMDCLGAVVSKLSMAPCRN
jgi:hypothetical protein